MIFYGKGSVWDKENHKLLCRFKNGKYKTDDKRTIDTLVKAGYKYEGELPGEKEKQETDMTVDELKSKLDELGIEYKTNAKKKELQKLLESAEEETKQEGD